MLTDLLAGELESRFPEAMLDLEGGFIVIDPLSTNPAAVSVGDLMGVLLDVEAKDWAESISEQVDGFESIAGDAFAPGSQEWLSSLRVLIYDAAYDNRGNTEPAWHEFVPGLQVAIVLDTGTAVSTVRQSELVTAELSYDEAFDLALAQTAAIEFFSQELEYVTVISGETIDATFYNGSSILGHTDLFQQSGLLGTLVVIATRESTILIDLEQASGGNPAEVTETVVFAGSTSYQDFLRGPSSVTPDMLWWYAGEFYLVEVSDTMIRMPDELLALLG